jgi:outer membrane protein TolC
MLSKNLIRLLLLWFICIFTPLHAFSQVAGEQSPPETKKISLEDLLKAAEEKNPAIKSARQAAEASKAAIPAAGALPDPAVQFQTMGNLFPPTLMRGDPSSARTYGVEQEIPFPGKLGLKENIASAGAEVKQWNYKRVDLKVMSELKQAFFDLYLVHKSTQILLKEQEFLKNFENIAEARYKVGQTTQQDILKAQLEESQILAGLLSQGEKKRIVEAKINSLLYRPSDTPVGTPAKFNETKLPYSLEELTRLALGASPQLKASESEQCRTQYGVELAQKDYYPDFNLGLTYFEREGNPGMWAPMVSVNLPIYFWRKQRPLLEAARLNSASARNSRDDTLSTIRYQIKEAYTTAATSEKLANLYRKAIIPQSNLALNSAVANYEVGKIDYLELIDSSISLFNYQLKYYQSMIAFQKALARLEPLIGVELIH